MYHEYVQHHISETPHVNYVAHGENDNFIILSKLMTTLFVISDMYDLP